MNGETVGPAPDFKYGIKQVVKLVESEETGTVVARAQYDADENQYLVRYKAGDGRQVKTWWGESDINAA